MYPYQHDTLIISYHEQIVPIFIYIYTIRTHRLVTATAVTVSERKKEDTIVLFSFFLFLSDDTLDTLLIAAPNIQY